ncbi:hypothetical protein DL770_008293 [Monosporascus sp. CRB-9-2]|nr:hypothetical protein DL770_008293 [Monosporascus sp. CRB-9-2]
MSASGVHQQPIDPWDTNAEFWGNGIGEYGNKYWKLYILYHPLKTHSRINRRYAAVLATVEQMFEAAAAGFVFIHSAA